MNKQWLYIWIERQRYVVIPLFLLSAAVLAPGGVIVNEQTQLIIALSAVALTGISHGSVDHLIEGQSLRKRIGLIWLISLYTALALSIGALWWICPDVSLILFLCLSVIHFGSDVDHAPHRVPLDYWSEALLRGAIPILVPCYTHPQSVDHYFRLLGCNSSVSTVDNAARALMLVFASVVTFRCLYYIARRQMRKEWLMQNLEHTALLLMCWLLPPLLSFTLYFCTLHSARHILRAAYRLDELNAINGLKRFACLAVPATIVSLLGASLIFVCTRSSLSAAEVQTLFISLSALTVPHMTLAFLTDVSGEDGLNNASTPLNVS